MMSRRYRALILYVLLAATAFFLGFFGYRFMKNDTATQQIQAQPAPLLPK